MYKNYDILVNKTNRLPEDYVPLDLREVRIPFDASPGDPKRWMREEAAKAAEALFARAAAAGIKLCGISGYRSYDRRRSSRTGLRKPARLMLVNISLRPEAANTRPVLLWMYPARRPGLTLWTVLPILRRENG